MHLYNTGNDVAAFIHALRVLAKDGRHPQSSKKE